MGSRTSDLGCIDSGASDLGAGLRTDLEAVAALLDHPRAAPQFALAGNRFHVHQAKAKQSRRRRGIKALIRPENAATILPHLPATPDDRTHCLLRGDFVLCDLIPAILEARGPCPHLRIATLGLSVANADTLARLVERGLVRRLDLIVSHYFQHVDKTTVFRFVEARLKNCARLTVTRSHAKVICLPIDNGTALEAPDTFVIEGSANLRSSDNIEQMLITNDPATLAFHAAWLDALATPDA